MESGNFFAAEFTGAIRPGADIHLLGSAGALGLHRIADQNRPGTCGYRSTAHDGELFEQLTSGWAGIKLETNGIGDKSWSDQQRPSHC